MDIKVYDKCILKKTKGREMGKRIEREKMTIQRMIALYQRRCPEAQADNAHYQALNAYADKRLDKCVFGENKPACKQCPGHCCKVSDEAAFCLIQRPYISKTLLTRRISPRGSP